MLFLIQHSPEHSRELASGCLWLGSSPHDEEWPRPGFVPAASDSKEFLGEWLEHEGIGLAQPLYGAVPKRNLREPDGSRLGAPPRKIRKAVGGSGGSRGEGGGPSRQGQHPVSFDPRKNRGCLTGIPYRG